MAAVSSAEAPARNGVSVSPSTEKCAVEVSFWIGGVGLAVLKGFAYLATGSVLVRASMFDSIGDVFSSAIMWITQWKMSDNSDAHRYPVGKWRFAPLGVLFFCAFMCSTMSSIALDSAQSLFAQKEYHFDPNSDGPGAQALRRLCDKQPELRAEFGIADPLAEECASGDFVPHVLLGVCVVAKFALYIFCRMAGRGGSEIVKALGDDHRNDTATNLLVTCSSIFISSMEGSEYDTPLMRKLDPALSLLMSLYITYGWVNNALEQIKVLSDARAEDLEIEAVRATARNVVKDKPLELCVADVYHMGEGYRVRLEISPTHETSEYTHVVALMEAVEAAVLSEMDEVKHVDVVLRLRQEQRKSSLYSWVSAYRRPPSGLST